MTANGIVDQSDRVQQSLSELTYRAYQIDEQVQSLKEQIAPQLAKLTHQLDRERKQPRKFIPLYDHDKFYQLNEQYLSRFNKTLLKLFFEIRQYKRIFKKYQSTLQLINSEVLNG